MATSIIKGQQGGTGTSSAAVSDIGKVLTVASVNPLTWSLTTASGGGGSGTVTLINSGTGVSGGPITTTGTLTANISTGISGGQSIYGGTAANENLSIYGTINATNGTSNVIIQPTGGATLIGTSAVTLGSGRLVISPSANNKVGLQIFGDNNASANMFEARLINGSIVTAITPTGLIRVQENLSNTTSNAIWIQPNAGSITYAQLVKAGSGGYTLLGVNGGGGPFMAGFPYTYLGDPNNVGTNGIVQTSQGYTGIAQLNIRNESTDTQALFWASNNANTKLFVITGSGSVGIGTASPTVPLDIRGNTLINPASLSISDSQTSPLQIIASGARLAIINQNSTAYYVGQYNTADVFTIGQVSAPYLNINTSGLVAIGTTTFTSKLRVTNAGEGVLNLNNSSSTNLPNVTIGMGSGSQHVDGRFFFDAASSPSVANQMFEFRYSATGSYFQIGKSADTQVRLASTATGYPLEILDPIAAGTATTGILLGTMNGGASTVTSGPRVGVAVSAAGFAPTSGNGTFAQFQVSTTINQTGGANGITRAVYITPTVTAAADFRSLETTVGNVVLGSTSGKVGIGTATPGGLLDISRAISGTTSSTIGAYLGISSSTFTDIVTAASGTNTGMAFNSIAAPALAATNASVTTTNAYNLYIAGAPTAGTNETLANTTALYIDATNVITGTNTFGLQVNAQTGGTNNYAAAFYGGNVGISTATPATRLHVVDTTAQLRLAYDSSNWHNLSTDSSNNLNISRGGSTSPAVIVGGGNTELYIRSTTLGSIHHSGTVFTIEDVSANALVLQGTGGKVGIGLTAPGQKLVVGDITAQNTLRINGLSTADMAPVLSIYRSGSVEWSIADNGTALQFGANPASYTDANLTSAAKMTLLTTGKVGIGATNPQAFLDIVGTTEQLRLEYDGSHYMSNTIDSSGNWNATPTGGGGFKFSGNMALGGTNIDPDIVLTTSSVTTDPSTLKTGANFSKTLTLTATNAQQITGGSFNVSTNANNFSQTGYIRGSLSTVQNSNTNTVSNVRAAEAYVYNVGAGTITDGRAGYFYLQNLVVGGTLTNFYGVKVDIGFNNGTVTNTYGVYVGSLISGTQTNVPYAFYASDATAKNYFAGPTGYGTTSPTAYVHMKAGTATASTAPLKFTAGTNLTSAEAGAMEFDGTSLFITDSLPNRRTIATTTGTQTLTLKRITKRVTTITSSATPTINTDNCDCVSITALAADITSMTTNLSGTPNDFDQLMFRIKDNGTARAITWGASFVAMGVALPTTTVISKILTVGFVYDTIKGSWCCIASAQEA